MAKTQTKRAKKTSAGTAKMKKNPMSETWKVLNNKGAFKRLTPVKGAPFRGTVTTD